MCASINLTRMWSVGALIEIGAQKIRISFVCNSQLYRVGFQNVTKPETGTGLYSMEARADMAVELGRDTSVRAFAAMGAVTRVALYADERVRDARDAQVSLARAVDATAAALAHLASAEKPDVHSTIDGHSAEFVRSVKVRAPPAMAQCLSDQRTDMQRQQPPTRFLCHCVPSAFRKPIQRCARTLNGAPTSPPHMATCHTTTHARVHTSLGCELV